ncbi:MAG: signal recognition particle-docking protein FtsY [Euryarchaeota archaeon]|nr:signal recognition particle-docking protein FtsY [Euryarchaeota archaeon]
MGLFDKFRKRVVEAEKEVGITVEEGSEEAKQAINKREIALSKKSNEAPEKLVIKEPKSEWDDIEDDIEDPFLSTTNSRDRKRARRERIARKAAGAHLMKKEKMTSTTGRRLVSSEANKFQIDLEESLANRGGRVVKGGKELENILNELEEELLSSDMGHSASSELMTSLRTHLIGARVNRKAKLEEVVEKALRGALLTLLKAGYWDFDRTIAEFIAEETPVILMMVGVNGTGKTTTSAKIAKRLDDRGYSVVLAAADTFRAGAIDQLAVHAERLGVRCIKSQRGGDSAAVARDAIESAKAKGDDVVIIDTSGRMQNKSNLMEELSKVHRVTAPHLVIFVADALAGNDAVSQAEEFQKRLSFDGAALCKLDTDARGGAALSITHATGRPIVLAGTGQGYDDLEPFSPSWLIDDLLS